MNATTAKIAPTLALSEGPLTPSHLTRDLDCETPASHFQKCNDDQESSNKVFLREKFNTTSQDENTVKMMTELKAEINDWKYKWSQMNQKWRTEQTLRLDFQMKCQNLEKDKLMLESYVQRLPSESEFDNLKTELELQNISHRSLKAQLENSHDDVKDKTGKLSILESRNQELELQLSEALKRVSVEQAIRNDEPQREDFIADKHVNDDERIKRALLERDNLELERKKLMKYMVLTKASHKKETGMLQNDLKKAKEDLMHLQDQLRRLSGKETEAQNIACQLRSQLEKAFAQVANQKEEILQLKRERVAQKLSRNQAEDQVKLIEGYRALLQELQNLSSALCQILDGEDPDVCSLLGVDPLSPTSTVSTYKAEGAHRQRKESSVTDFHSSLFHLEHQLRHKINEMREKISEHYAENLDTNSGCHTQ